MVLCYIHSSVLWNSFNNQLNHCAYSAVIHIVIHTVYYNPNTKLHHQHYVISSTLHYIINAASCHQCCMISSTQYYIVNAALFQQGCITSSMSHYIINAVSYTAQKMKFSIQDFFSKCDQIRSFLRIWSHLLKKP